MGKKAKEFKAGDFIFAKVKGYPAWPARVQRINGKKYFVYFYGTAEIANLPPNQIFDYAENKEKFLSKSMKRKDFNEGIRQIEYDFTNKIPLEEVLGAPLEEPMDTTSVSQGDDTANDTSMDVSSAADTTADSTADTETNKSQNQGAVDDSDEGALVIDEKKKPKKTPAKPAKETKATPKAKGKQKKEETPNEEEGKKEEEIVSRSGRKIRPKRYIDEHTEENATLAPVTKKKRAATPPAAADKEKEKAPEKTPARKLTNKQCHIVAQSELEDIKEPFPEKSKPKPTIPIFGKQKTTTKFRPPTKSIDSSQKSNYSSKLPRTSVENANNSPEIPKNDIESGHSFKVNPKLPQKNKTAQITQSCPELKKMSVGNAKKSKLSQKNIDNIQKTKDTTSKLGLKEPMVMNKIDIKESMDIDVEGTKYIENSRNEAKFYEKKKTGLKKSKEDAVNKECSKTKSLSNFIEDTVDINEYNSLGDTNIDAIPLINAQVAPSIHNIQCDMSIMTLNLTETFEIFTESAQNNTKEKTLNKSSSITNAIFGSLNILNDEDCMPFSQESHHSGVSVQNLQNRNFSAISVASLKVYKDLDAKSFEQTLNENEQCINENELSTLDRKSQCINENEQSHVVPEGEEFLKLFQMKLPILEKCVPMDVKDGDMGFNVYFKDYAKQRVFYEIEDDKESILIAYLPNGQYVGVKLFQSKPNSFSTENGKLQWYRTAAANAITLKGQLEKGQITAQSMSGQLETELNLTEEEKANLDKEREIEEKKSRVQFLKTEMKLIELDSKIKSCLSLEKADAEMCLQHLNELLEMDIVGLMLLKHPTCLETIKRSRSYVGNTPSWEMSHSDADTFSKHAHEIRKLADSVYTKFKKLFHTPEGLTFWEAFSERVMQFKKCTSKLNADALLEMMHEPIEMSTPTSHTNVTAVETANEDDDKAAKKKSTPVKSKKPPAKKEPATKPTPKKSRGKPEAETEATEENSMAQDKEKNKNEEEKKVKQDNSEKKKSGKDEEKKEEDKNSEEGTGDSTKEVNEKDEKKAKSKPKKASEGDSKAKKTSADESKSRKTPECDSKAKKTSADDSRAKKTSADDSKAKKTSESDSKAKKTSAEDSKPKKTSEGNSKPKKTSEGDSKSKKPSESDTKPKKTSEGDSEDEETNSNEVKETKKNGQPEEVKEDKEKLDEGEKEKEDSEEPVAKKIKENSKKTEPPPVSRSQRKSRS